MAIGAGSGFNLTTGNWNIHIVNAGLAGEAQTIRIGDSNHLRTFIAGIRGTTTVNNNAVNVVIDSAGQLGTISSSRRFKNDIHDMADASSPLMSLRPVTFRYKTDQQRALHYGLIAEEVAMVYPGMVARSADGQVETVMYQFLAPMLLNEVQKQQRVIGSQAQQIVTLMHDRTAQAAELAALKQDRIAQSAELADLRRAVEVLLARMPADVKVAATQ